MEKIFKYPLLILGIIGIVTVFFALQIPKAQLDNNNLRFVPESDEARKVSAYIDDTFGSSFFILVGLEREYGTVFDGDFLNRIRQYVEQVEDIEITGVINSIVNSDYITASGDAILVKPLVSADFTGTGEEIVELRRRLLSWDMYRRSLISDDFTATQILIPLDISGEDAGRPEVIDSFVHIRDMAREVFDGFAEVYVTGLPVISATINEAVNADLVLLVPLVVVVVLLILFFSFRNLTAVILPILTVLIAVIWSMGAMPLFNVKLSVISTVLPVILVAVGSAYGIHVMTHYLEEGGRDISDPEEHRAYIFALIKKIGKPVFLAALTTFVGFFSFCFTSVLPIREFGIFSSFGVLVSFVVALVLIPSLLLLRGPKPFCRPAKRTTAAGTPLPGDPLDNALANFFGAVVRKRRIVLFLFLGITAISLYGISKVVIDNIFVEYFKAATDISRSDRFIREKFGGSKVVSVVVEAESPEILLHPASLGALENLNRYLEERVPEVGKVMGFTDLIKRINQVFNADEDPDGIKGPSPALPPESSDDFGFGFGFESDDFESYDSESYDSWGFGFGGNGETDFGFGDFGDPGEFDGTGGDNQVGNSSSAPSPERVYTTGELIALLRDAANSGVNRSPDAAELVRQLERLTNFEGASYYEIPVLPERYGKTRPEELGQLLSNYLVLLSSDIASYANDPLEPTAVKTTVQLRTLGQEDTDRAIEEIYRYTRVNFPENLKVIVGGSALVESSLNRLVVQSQMTSVITSLLMVFLIITLSNRSVLAGLIGIVPLSISILINFAAMGFLGIKLNIGTSMVASVSVGIGIDYTIHYLETYKREYRLAGGRGDFLRRTFTTSGKAIIINALSVGAGFAVLLLSQFIMLEDLGLLIAMTMGTSALVSMTVIPVLLLLINPRFIRNELNRKES